MNSGSVKRVEISGVCSICLDDLKEHRDVVITRCAHAYHEQCVTTYLKISEQKRTSCPNCRQVPIPLIRAQERSGEVETNPFIECKMLQALRFGETEYVKAALLAEPSLIEKRYESKVNNVKYTLLTLATAFGHQDLVVFLLDRVKKEWIDEPNSNGLTALSAACMSGHTQIAKLLIAAGAKVNKLNHIGKSALWYAAGCGNVETLELLVEAGAVVTHKSEEDCTPLLMAARRGHLDAVNYLISVIPQEKLQEHVNICSSGAASSATALYMAAQEGYTAIVSALIAAKADPNLAITGGQIPLHIAALNGHLEVIKILVANGTNVNYQDPYGITAIFGAAERGHREVCEYLLKANANPSLTSNEGAFNVTISAAMIARQYGHLDLADYLENYPH